MYPLALIKKVLADLDKDHHYQIVLFGGGTKEIIQLDTFENEFASVINTAGKLNFTEELVIDIKFRCNDFDGQWQWSL